RPGTRSGCLASSLQSDQEVVGGGIRFYRKHSEDAGARQVETPASDRGYLLGMSLRSGHRRRIYEGRRGAAHDFGTDALYIRNFADRYRAELEGPFDFLLVELPRAAIDRLTDENGCGTIDGLAVVTGRQDPLLSSLLRVLLPVLARPQEAGPLFLDQLALAIGTCVVERHGGRPLTRVPRHRRLSRPQEARAKEMLHGHTQGGVSIADVAQACQLSRSYFTHAFRQTTGQTPHQWVLAQRVQRAREMLVSSPLTLAEIATACGFADQSHFTRVFSRATGLPPAQWRRRQ
ncbi:MAG: AraC family transcriptional regulator, partial [Betaproteobacteria bacterium]